MGVLTWYTDPNDALVRHMRLWCRAHACVSVMWPRTAVLLSEGYVWVGLN